MNRGPVRDLIDHAKANPAKLSYGSAGSGSSQHVGMEMFKLITGTHMIHVPFKAIQQAAMNWWAARPSSSPRTSRKRSRNGPTSSSAPARRSIDSVS